MRISRSGWWGYERCRTPWAPEITVPGRGLTLPQGAPSPRMGLIDIPREPLKGPPGALRRFSPHPGRGVLSRVMGLECLCCGCRRDDKKARGDLPTGVIFCRHKQGAGDRWEINAPPRLLPASAASAGKTCRELGRRRPRCRGWGSHPFPRTLCGVHSDVPGRWHRPLALG